MRNYILPNENSFGDVDDLKKISDLIRLDEPYEKGGLPLYSNTSQMLVSTNDTHSLILGTTGSRKTRSFVFPMVLNIAGAKEKEMVFVYGDQNNKLNFYNHNKNDLYYDDSNDTCFGSFFILYKRDKDTLKLRIPYNMINFVMKRTYFYRANAIEIFTSNQKSYYLLFYTFLRKNSTTL